MKKLALTIAIVLGLATTTFADNYYGGGLFQRGIADEEYYGMGYYSNREGGGLMPTLPGHGETDNQDAPLGSGIALLAGLGAAYLVGKRHKKDE